MFGLQYTVNIGFVFDALKKTVILHIPTAISAPDEKSGDKSHDGDGCPDN
jgi:hypothetical protein